MTTRPPVFDRLSSLADPIRARLLLALERQELTVSELRSVLQLPQSTVSRHLKLLADEGWLLSRANGTSNWYRLVRDLDPGARRLWQAVREPVAKTPAARRDAGRIRAVLAARHSRSQEFFATTAGRWDRLRAGLFGPATQWLALGGLLDPDWTVADLGAGTGELAAILSPLVRRVIALDQSSAMLQAARHRLKGLANVEVRNGALEALPLQDGTVHLALAVLVLHHLIEPPRAVTEAARVLAPGGRLVVVDMAPHQHTEYREQMGHQWLGFAAETVTAWFAATSLQRPSYRPLPPHPAAKGPTLFVASAFKAVDQRLGTGGRSPRRE